MKIGKIILLLIVLYILYDIVRPSIDDFLLKRNGLCVKAKLTSEVTRVKYHKGELKYEFTLDGVSFQGNSLETDKNKVADSVCIIYLKSRPSINKPVEYFDGAAIDNCNCK